MKSSPPKNIQHIRSAHTGRISGEREGCISLNQNQKRPRIVSGHLVRLSLPLKGRPWLRGFYWSAYSHRLHSLYFQNYLLLCTGTARHIRRYLFCQDNSSTRISYYDPPVEEWADFAAEMYAKGHSFFTYRSDSVDSLYSIKCSENSNDNKGALKRIKV